MAGFPAATETNVPSRGNWCLTLTTPKPGAAADSTEGLAYASLGSSAASERNGRRRPISVDLGPYAAPAATRDVDLLVLCCVPRRRPWLSYVSLEVSELP